jgi:ABC-2 type transport system permease protein
MSMIYTDLIYNLKMFCHNKPIFFWLVGFPVILFLLFCYLLGGTQGAYTLYYVDHGGTATSAAFLNAMNATGAIRSVDSSGIDLAGQLKDGKIADYIEIPPGFGDSAGVAGPAGGKTEALVQVYYDKSKTESAAFTSIIGHVVDRFNLESSGTSVRMGMDTHDVATSGMSFLAFLLPGIIGITICTAGLSGTVSSNAHNRTNGIFRKLATAPISRINWNVSKIVFQALLMMLSIVINPMMIALIFAGSVAFSGIGLIVTSPVKDEEAAMSTANAAGFPLMFLSGSIFPVSQLPRFLQIIPVISPPTYLNDGLQGSYGNRQ